MKCTGKYNREGSASVAPARERGLKCNHAVPRLKNLKVAPARERGLKSCGQCLGCRLDKGRSREGAWIEISDYVAILIIMVVAPARERGLKLLQWTKAKWEIVVAPARERGLKLYILYHEMQQQSVAPARERGLKLLHADTAAHVARSLPRGSVD